MSTSDRFRYLFPGLAFFLVSAAPAHAELYRARDSRGHTVVTNLKTSGARKVTGGTLSVASTPGTQRPLLRMEIPPATRGVSAAKKAPFDAHIASAAARHNLSRRLIEAVIAVESGFDPRAVSRTGAQGLMQLMPGTARDLEVADPFDPAANIDGGSRYLRQMLDQFGQNLTLALAAYNAGPTTVATAGGVPVIKETVDYVRKVNALLGRGVLSYGASSLTASRSRDGRLRLTNIGPTQSSMRLERDARGFPSLTNR